MLPEVDLTLGVMPDPQSLDDLARTQIRRWLESTGHTQTSLAEQIGKNQAWMSRYLKGVFNADLTTLDKLAAAFNHNLASLLNVPEDPDVARLVRNYRAARPQGRRLLLELSQEITRPARRKTRTR